jgi:hypothetical protein
MREMFKRVKPPWLRAQDRLNDVPEQQAGQKINLWSKRMREQRQNRGFYREFSFGPAARPTGDYNTAAIFTQAVFADKVTESFLQGKKSG